MIREELYFTIFIVAVVVVVDLYALYVYFRSKH